ncbi:MAG TPA: FkbM family methyltransferase [Stellaceae bacterium]|nr:FkbM family methyltransferase [Stellaceae bacterium]
MKDGIGRNYFRFRLNPGFFAHLFKAVFKQHHRALEPVLAAFIPADAIVFDVGAHAGQFTKLFARMAPKGFVYAFEPGTYARAILRVAARLNAIGNVAILPLALGERSGVSVLRVPVKRSGSYGFGLAHLGGDASAGAEFEVVGLATLDEVAATLRLERLDFIKADIEGYELRLIKGARATLGRFKPALLLEHDATRLARAGDTLQELWNELVSLGYRPHEASPARPPLDAPRGGDVLWLARG